MHTFFSLRNPVLLLLICYSSGFALADTQRTYRIGLAVWSGYHASVQGFKDGLASKGLVEGENVMFLVGETAASKSVQQNVAHRFNDAGVDLVYSLTTPGTSVMKEIIEPDTPIVFSIVTYPADSGLIESFEYSGNNLVGTSNYVPTEHFLTLMRLIVPNVQTVAIFHRKGEPNSRIQASNLIRMLKQHDIRSLNYEPASIGQVIHMANEAASKVDMFITTTDTLMQSGGEDALITISLAKKIPILSSNKQGIVNGATFGPVADFYTLGKMAGVKAARILLENTLPTDLESEVQSPPHFLINLTSIKQLALPVPSHKQVTFTYTEERVTSSDASETPPQ
ncbi:ABC transporter substrate-binding protein [Thaumasiovibrio subtropicus]|uniref:ABC transporter substrate-binding protein n=1 Tax=Thaumasiovibrio subtropicus TaxID=1891207 RepID=UPI000B358C4B|nr:ABC transporter substrate-binding protein [Thaumasiovibrio subtropicus]